MRRLVLMTAVGAVCASGALASPAGAAPTWGALAPLTSTAFEVDLATDAHGRTVVVWTEGSFAGGDYVTRVHAAFRSPGSAFGAPQVLSEAGEDASDTQVAMDDAGNAVAVWLRKDGSGIVCCDRVQAAVRPAGGSFRAAQTLSAAGASASDPEIAVRNGRGVAVWDGPSVIEAATASLPNGFGAAAAISIGGGLFPRVAIDGSGNALAVWAQFVGFGSSRIHSAFRPADGAFAAPQLIPVAPSVPGAIGSPGSASSPEVAFDPDGRAIVAYEGSDGYSPAIPCCTRALAAVRSGGPSGTWGTPAYLSTEKRSAGDAEVVATGSEAVAIWSETATETATGVSASEYNVRAAARPNGAATAFGARQDVSGPARDITTPRLFAAQTGAINAAWRQWDRVETAHRPVGGSFQPATTLFTAGDRLDLGQVYAVGTNVCDGLIAWKHQGLQLAVGDTDGPPTMSLDAPAVAQAGTTVSMSASAADGCSAPTVAWAFGDGTTGAGATAAHAYAAAGTYTVSATARDAAGNTTRVTRTVVVSAPERTTTSDRTAPAISAFGVTRARFRVARKVAARRETAAGTTFTFRVSEAGAATIAVQRKVKRRWKPAGALRHSAAAGVGRLPFTGRVGEKPLAAGAYRATLKVVDAAGNVSLPRRTTFRVVGR